MRQGSFATRPEQAADAGQPITVRELSRRSGVSVTTISQLARSKMIPRAVGQDKEGNQLYDLADPKLAAWLTALQAAGYNRRP